MSCRFELFIWVSLIIHLNVHICAGEWPLAYGGVHPRVSPDGAAVAVSYQGAICLQSRGELRRLSRGGGWDIEPAWSPDGKTIGFLRGPSFSGGALRLVDVGTGQEIPLPKRINGQGKLQFGPDGRRILGGFAGGRPGWVSLETGEVAPVPVSFAPEDEFAWRRKRIRFALSPAGDELLFAVHRDETDEQGGNRGPQADVWRCGADGSSPERQFEWPARIYDLCWDEDGRGVFAVTDLGVSHNDIWFIPFENSLRKARRMTHGLADEDRPSVTRAGDGSGRLVFSTNVGGATAIVSRSLPRGERGWAPDRFESVTDWAPDDPLARLSVRCVDAVGPDAEAAVARISILRIGGKFHAPPGSLYRLTGGQGHFYAQESGEFRVPPGEYRIIARRGPEFGPAEATVTLAEGESRAVELNLERWVDMAGRGWYSGENHVHANYGYGEWYNTPETILRQCLGENLNVCNAVVANSDGDAIFDREFFRGELDPRSTDNCKISWGQEFRSTIWGHMTLSRLARLTEPIMTGFPGTTNPYDVPTNADVALLTTERGGVIGYTHPASNYLDLYDQPYAAKGLPVDAALGRVALMDVHGHTYRGSVQLWYRLMNCGLRVVASSGTDVFLNRVRSLPPGFARTYVRLADGLTYDAWTKGQVEGRSFITSGPMLTLEVNGAGMGREVSLGAQRKVTVKAKAEAQYPLDRVELVRNGHVELALPLTDDKLKAGFEGEIDVPESGWIALRAHGPAHREAIREPNAHTNPVWITVEGKPNSMGPTDAAYFLKWIARLEADVTKRDRIPGERNRKHVREQFEEARKYYQMLLTRGG